MVFYLFGDRSLDIFAIGFLVNGGGDARALGTGLVFCLYILKSVAVNSTVMVQSNLDIHLRSFDKFVEIRGFSFFSDDDGFLLNPVGGGRLLFACEHVLMG